MTLPADNAEAASGTIRFNGRRRVYLRILARGAVLLMFTLGIYRFWLTTDVRRFLWANTEIDGDGLEYTGTPLELLIGFLLAIVILIPVYTAFFIAALDLGTIGQLSGIIAFAGIGIMGQYAVYRARRYRLTRTVFRGLRFHQEGSAWRYALCASFWWILTALTLGLAYPFQLASLERFKMRYTYYGELGGEFTGSGLRLFLRGLAMWVVVMGPLLFAIYAFITMVNWYAILLAVQEGGDDVMAVIEGASPLLGEAFVFALLMGLLAMTAAALLYPAFQAMVLRWWSSGLRFGTLEMRSTLRTRQVYAAYMRFLWYGGLFAIVAGICALPTLWLAERLGGEGASLAGEAGAAIVLVAGYVIMALGFSTIYRATVMLSLWQLGMESLQLSGLSALDNVKAKGRASSPLGEGLADALNVGGY